MNQLLLIPCLFKKVFGFECPGCGIQRAIILLFQGRIADSFTMYPALLPMILLISYLTYKILAKKQKPTIDYTLITLFVIVAISIIANYSYKIISGHML